MPHPNGEPTNQERADRMTPVVDSYCLTLGERREDPSREWLACIVADMRHWCDANGVEWASVTDLAAEHYNEEAQA